MCYAKTLTCKLKISMLAFTEVSKLIIVCLKNVDA